MLTVLASIPLVSCAFGGVDDLPEGNLDPDLDGAPIDENSDTGSTSAEDSGATEPDSAMGSMDTGTATHDTGVTPHDTGTTPVDTGTAMDTGTTCTPTGTLAGAESAFPVGTYKKVGNVIVGHDAGGYYAFTDVCTHQGCTMSLKGSPGWTYCPCHGATFDQNGVHKSGPGSRALANYQVTLCAGNIYFNTKTVVAMGTRVT